MNISQSAIDNAVAATAGAVGSATAKTVIEAALPYLLADLRERLAKAAVELDKMRSASGLADSYGPLRETDQQIRLGGKREGVRLALSYLDEMTR